MSASSERRLGRRQFLGLLGALAVVAVLPTRALGLVRQAAIEPHVLDAEHDPVGGLDGIDAVGTVYLAETPDEATPQALRQSLGFKPQGDSTKRTKQLARRIAADFEAGDIVALDGWRLSRSEARWAALQHLERSGVA